MQLRNALFLTVFVLLFVSCTHQEIKRPNIVIILTDDQGWGDISSHGNPDISTPNIDQLADDGARFHRFFVSPVCAPTRASLLTGRDHLRTGTQWVTYGLENMRADEETFAEIFRDAGYKTGLFGKWHNGSHYPMDPKGQGFDTFFGFKQGHWNNYFDTELEYNGNPVKTKGFITDVLTDSALAFIEHHREDPFLAFIPYNAPHSPFQVRESYFQKYKAEGLSDKNAAVYGMVENVDDNIGRIISILEALDLSENTIVVFMTDNGPNGNDRFNGLMKGWKAKVDEGGVRVPLFIKWPTQITPGRKVEELTAHIDFLPTLVELAGLDVRPQKPWDGRSFAPLIFQDNPNWPDRYLYTHQSRWDSLERYPASVRNNQFRAVRYGNDWELYDLKSDSSQSKNVAVLHPEVIENMSHSYLEWFEEVTTDLKGKTSIPVGYSQSPKSNLPAVESYFSEGLRFYGLSGWSNDWVTGWSAENQRIWWEIEVQEAGEFEVSIEYGLPEEEDGVEVRLQISGNEIKTNLAAHNAMEVPSPDRVERGEVYEKVWGWQKLGTMNLNQGEQKLEFQLIPRLNESSKFEIKSLELKRIN